MADKFPDFRDLGGSNKDNPSDISIYPWGRLYNFKTGHFDLNNNHTRWIRENLAQVYKRKGGGTIWVDLWGYASKIGSPSFNDTLSQQRAAEVKKYLAAQVNSPADMERVRVGGYGTSHSGGGMNDNSPIFRGVDVYMYLSTAPKPVPPPRPVKPPEIKPEKKMYIGLGVKGGGFLAVGGAQALEARLYSVDDYNDHFNADGEIWNLGLGLGGGVNIVLCIAYGATNPGQFCGCKFGGPDFNISLGERWGDAIKGAKSLPTVARLAKAVQDSKMTLQALKMLLKLSPGEWEQLSNLAKAAKDALGADSSATRPQFNSFDVPLAGVALELDAYYSWGTIATIY